MTMLPSQITSLTVVYSIVCSGVDQSKHQSSASLAFVQEIHRGPVNFPHKWPVTRKMFPFDDVIMKYLILSWRYGCIYHGTELVWPPVTYFTKVLFCDWKYWFWNRVYNCILESHKESHFFSGNGLINRKRTVTGVCCCKISKSVTESVSIMIRIYILNNTFLMQSIFGTVRLIYELLKYFVYRD